MFLVVSIVLLVLLVAKEILLSTNLNNIEQLSKPLNLLIALFIFLFVISMAYKIMPIISK
jgi:hypothetical protein